MQQESHTMTGYKAPVMVFFGLITLTVLTVMMGTLHLPPVQAILIAMGIALVKASLVVVFFMHLKYERGIFKVMFFVTIITLTIFIGFTFFDISYR